jgi:hypothetical protein
MSRRIMMLAAAAFAAAGLAACGEQPQVVVYKQGAYQGKPDQPAEQPQVVVYKQGAYQGKPDQPAWAGAPWNGNKTEWDTAIRTRNQNQNEYKRTN